MDEGLHHAILACVQSIPPGCVMTYGDVAEYCGTRSARLVGRVLASTGDTPVDEDVAAGGGAALPWWRVLRADGSLAPHLFAEQRARLMEEDVRFNADRVDLKRHRWDGQAPPPSSRG